MGICQSDINYSVLTSIPVVTSKYILDTSSYSIDTSTYFLDTIVYFVIVTSN